MKHRRSSFDSNTVHFMPHSSSGQDRGFLILRYRFESCMRLSCTVRETLASAMCVRLNICPRRLMDRPGGYGPSDARSIRAGDTVTVADMVMQRIVDPPYAGSNPVSHLQKRCCRKGLQPRACDPFRRDLQLVKADADRDRRSYAVSGDALIRITISVYGTRGAPGLGVRSVSLLVMSAI